MMILRPASSLGVTRGATRRVASSTQRAMSILSSCSMMRPCLSAGPQVLLRSLSKATGAIEGTLSTCKSFAQSSFRICAPFSNFRFMSTVSAAIPSCSTSFTKIRIRFASQGGTAQMFSMQLCDAIQDAFGDFQVDVAPWASVAPQDLLLQGSDPETLTILICSTTGVGEPPDNGRDLFRYLTSDDATKTNSSSSNFHYCIFGLGNQAAHPNHYNAVAKTVDHALGESGVLPLALGNDADCIEDDFDQWQAQILNLLKHGNNSATAIDKEPLDTHDQAPSIVASAGVRESEANATQQETAMKTVLCPGAKSSNGRRRVSAKHPLQLQAPLTSYVRTNLMKVAPELYPKGCKELRVQANDSLNSDPASNGLHELRIELGANMTYGTGDHFEIFPRNPDFLVDALCQVLDVDPHAVIVYANDKRYPHPTKISVYETLSHCVDLGAVPSPSFCKRILDRTDIDYKNEVAIPRKTALELVLSMSSTKGLNLALEDWLYNLPPMQGRYYSIATTPLLHPDELYLTYRPVKYVTNQGSLRRGTCTSYMSNLTGGTSHLVGAIKSNPTFRLPDDPATPVILIAGGCGVAPIRGFLEERIAFATLSGNKAANMFGTHKHHLLFLGFRNPADAVYQDLVDQAKALGAVNKSFITYTTGCSSGKCEQVTDSMRKYGQELVYHSLTVEGGHLFVCGGARSFGAAVQRELLEVFKKIGNMSEEAAAQRLRDIVSEGRIHEDLSD
ncbi:hypothetical protein MPSEU_000337900 [Mayamaea pseudoterrestris]|nr:hypothetical protein MPSEU_000337900 [Mayamaea pseudoterrestris]